jgi:hypothetical protein
MFSSIHGAAKKWHPGHYMLVYNNAPQQRYDIIFESPYWLGVQVRYTWPQLEPEKDQYDFSAIISDIDYLKPHREQWYQGRIFMYILMKIATDPFPCVTDDPKSTNISAGIIFPRNGPGD